MTLINLQDYERSAEACLDPTVWGYIQGGSDDEVTLRANSSAYSSLRLRPRVLVDVSECTLATTVLGSNISMPIGIAPMGCQGLVHPNGDYAMARAAEASETLMIVSTMANHSLETIAQATKGLLWFQLYVYRDRKITEALVRRVEAAGYQALVLTVDVPYLGRRERDVRNGFALPSHLHFANFAPVHSASEHQAIVGESGIATHASARFDPALTWQAIDWLRSITRLPIVLKGILIAEDAQRAINHGVNGMIVSNHGGRQLDTVPPTLDCLAEIVDTVGSSCDVYLDGGIRRGTDVLKARALGARMVFVGRPLLWGLAVDGQTGAAHVLELLRTEYRLALALVGCAQNSALDRTYVDNPRLISR